MRSLLTLLQILALFLCCARQVDSQTLTRIEVNGNPELILGTQESHDLSAGGSAEEARDIKPIQPPQVVLTESTIEHRARVGPQIYYDLVAAGTFSLLASLGLREHHRLLDIGCGSLRNGRLLIPYLNAGNYVGIEPDPQLVHAGLTHEIGHDLVAIKRPKFVFAASAEALSKSPDEQFNLAVAQSVFSHRVVGSTSRIRAASFPAKQRTAEIVMKP